LPVAPDVDLVPGTGFDVTVETLDGQAVEEVANPVTLHLALSSDERRNGAAIYWLDGEAPTRLENSRLDASGISVPLTHFSRFVVGVPLPTEPSQRDWLPWIIASGGALVVAAGMATAVVRRRRHHAASLLPDLPADW